MIIFGSRTLVTSLALVGALGFTTQAVAGSVSLTLTRATLNTVGDVAGFWQHEGGDIKKGAAVVGYYVITRRVTAGGTTPFNAAMTTVNLMFSNTSTPPQNITLQGTHSYGNGYFFGGVSAASARYSYTCNGQATISPTAAVGVATLSLQWNGSTTLTLP